ncbi:MAG: type II secretion system protein, partial [Dehalococcoidia bacterium]|nr:type II secretion system protein [Dehalococcoidia bacterium]
MRIPKRGEKGFTLIELLIVVAILGVLAAVVVPNVGRFLGRGETEARRAEKHNIQASVTAMMTDNNLVAIPNPLIGFANATKDMSSYP